MGRNVIPKQLMNARRKEKNNKGGKMKKNFRFCKVVLYEDYHNKKKRVYYAIQKKGWFGWKTMSDIYDGNFCYHHSFSYFHKPQHVGMESQFESVEHAISFLRAHYGKKRAEVTCS